MASCLATGPALLIQEANRPMRLRRSTTVYVREPPPIIGNSARVVVRRTIPPGHWRERVGAGAARARRCSRCRRCRRRRRPRHLSAARTIFVGSKRKPNSRQAFPSANSHIQELKPKRHSSGPAAKAATATAASAKAAKAKAAASKAAAQHSTTPSFRLQWPTAS